MKNKDKFGTNLGQARLVPTLALLNSTPVIVGHQLFLRSNRFLYCIEAGAGG
jgi:hypothetical protein